MDESVLTADFFTSSQGIPSCSRTPLPVVLHEDEIPKLHQLGGSHPSSQVIVDLSTGPTRASIPHLPEVLLWSKGEHAAGRHPGKEARRVVGRQRQHLGPLCQENPSIKLSRRRNRADPTPSRDMPRLAGSLYFPVLLCSRSGHKWGWTHPNLSQMSLLSRSGPSPALRSPPK